MLGIRRRAARLPILGYYTNYLIDNDSRVILGVEATPARLSQEIVAARKMLNNLEENFGIKPQCLAADTAYGTGEFLAWLIDEKGIEPHIPVKEWHGQNHGAFTRRDFTFQPDDNSFTCPGGKRLPFIGVSNLTRINYYKADPSDCAACALKANCTPGRARRIGVHWEEAARQAARSLIDTERFSRSIRERKRIESLFADLKTRFNLRRLRLRRLRNASEQLILAATAQNLKRLVKFLNAPTPVPA